MDWIDSKGVLSQSLAKQIQRYEVASQDVDRDYIDSLAWDLERERQVRIREPLPHRLDEPSYFERFLGEGRLYSRLSDPSVISLYEVDAIAPGDQRCCFVFEYWQRSIEDILLAGNYQYSEVPSILTNSLLGLLAIHEAGLLHSNIRPSSIAVIDTGTTKLTNLREGWSRTIAGTLVQQEGKYLPRECWSNDNTSGPWSDLYSLGFVVYELLVGSARLNELMGAQLLSNQNNNSKPTRARRQGARFQSWHADPRLHAPDVREINPAVEPVVAQVLAKMMRKDPGERYRSAADILELLDGQQNVAVTRFTRKTVDGTSEESKVNFDESTGCREFTPKIEEDDWVTKLSQIPTVNEGRERMREQKIGRTFSLPSDETLRDLGIVALVIIVGLGIFYLAIASS